MWGKDATKILTNIPFICLATAARIQASSGGQVARRAAALCNALNLCSPDDGCLISSIAVPSSIRAAMDFW